MKCFSIPSDSDDDDKIFEEQVCPICGPAGGIEASDDGNRDQSCGTCGKVLLKDGKKVDPRRLNLFQKKFEIPDTNEFKKLFPDVDVKNIKLTARTRGSGDEYMDTKTGIRYLYGGRPRGMGWRLDVPKFPNTEKRNPWTLPHLPDINLFIEMFPDVNLASLKQEDTQFVDKSTGDVYAYNHVDGWKKMITREEDKSPPKLRELFPGVIFREVIPGIQYKDSNGNVYGKFEKDGWKILPKPKY